MIWTMKLAIFLSVAMVGTHWALIVLCNRTEAREGSGHTAMSLGLSHYHELIFSIHMEGSDFYAGCHITWLDLAAIWFLKCFNMFPQALQRTGKLIKILPSFHILPDEWGHAELKWYQLLTGGSVWLYGWKEHTNISSFLFVNKVSYCVARIGSWGKKSGHTSVPCSLTVSVISTRHSSSPTNTPKRLINPLLNK